MTRQIALGIISFAHGHAHSYAKCIDEIAEAHLAGVYDDDINRGQRAARQYATGFFSSIDELLALELDGVIICSENAKHRNHLQESAGRVAAILCEKPIATTLDDARAMIDHCAETNTKLQVAFPVRFAPAIQRVKEMLDAHELGRIYAVKCTNHGSMPGQWFVDEALSGGGAVMDHTVHVIDLLRWFWETEVVEVYAEIGENLLHQRLGIDDAGILSFRLANGVYGTLDTSWSRPRSYLTWGDVKLAVVGQNGSIQVDAFEQHLLVAADKTGKSRWQNWGSNMDLGLVKNFVDSIRSGEPPLITGLDGLKSLQVALAAYQSAQTGYPISISH